MAWYIVLSPDDALRAVPSIGHSQIAVAYSFSPPKESQGWSSANIGTWFGYLDQEPADAFVGVRQKSNPIVLGKTCCFAGRHLLACLPLREPDVSGKLGGNL
jgi:hypothetical protein